MVQAEDGGSSSGAGEHEQFAAQLAAFAERSQRVVQAFWQRQLEEQAKGGFQLVDPKTVGSAFLDWGARLMADPARLADAQIDFWKDQLRLWQFFLHRMAGEQAEPLIQPERQDRRFKDPIWSEELLYDYVKQSYLLSSKWLRGLANSVDGLDPKEQQKVDFYTRQFISALAPTNFALSNPAVLKKVQETRGQNLIDGLQHLLDDLERGRGRLQITMTDEEAFEVGSNVATSAGAVVFQNDLMQLIQYAPLTEKVRKRPLLIVPPWINKFYILDLQPKNSFIRHAVAEGHTVFVISWANPNKELAHKSFDDYMLEGPLAALDAIEQATGEADINILGFCIGGILVSGLLGYLAVQGQNRIRSATFLASMFDFKQAGETQVFIDDEQIRSIERHIAEKGYLEGHHMGDMFSMMRENDLIWSFVVNNYLLGREAVAFDLLYWNADNTRLPAKMLVFYLKEFYRHNRLRKPDGISLAGTPIDLSKVITPTYLMAAKDDHIAPWRACYPGVHLLAGPSRFILSASGHVAGVINPPEARKYGYWTREDLPKDPDGWLEEASWHQGSWWPDWHAWLRRHAGRLVAPREVGSGALAPLEPAPGSYVKVRGND